MGGAHQDASKYDQMMPKLCQGNYAVTSNCCHLQSLSLDCTRFKTKSQNSRKTTLNIWEDVGRYLLAKGNIYCQHADEQIWQLFSHLLLFWFIVGQCLPKLLCKRMLCKPYFPMS